jgi:type 1 glutamine amidotransferase
MILMTLLAATLVADPTPTPRTAAEAGAEAAKVLGFDPYDQSGVPLEVEPPANFPGKKIVLVAGAKSHGPGDHEFFAGTAILCQLLRQNGVWPVMARDGWPKNEKIFDGAASFVFYMDGRAGHPVVKNDRLKLLQRYIDAGVGWVNLHYAVDYLPQDGETVVRWMGGFYDPRTSINPHWDADIRYLPKHPITNGVKPFKLRDEWYYNMHWVGDVVDVKDAVGVTPILQAIPPDETRKTDDARKYPGRLETMAWAYERQDGGRGFGFTGGHTHANWGNEDFRRVVTNSILWTAKVDIPAEGAAVEFDPIDLNRNLDFKTDRKGVYAGFKKIVPPATLK